ncbi:hypothetical protein D3C84_801100 [compost metagenome]
MKHAHQRLRNDWKCSTVEQGCPESKAHLGSDVIGSQFGATTIEGCASIDDFSVTRLEVIVSRAIQLLVPIVSLEFARHLPLDAIPQSDLKHVKN